MEDISDFDKYKFSTNGSIQKKIFENTLLYLKMDGRVFAGKITRKGGHKICKLISGTRFTLWFLPKEKKHNFL